MANNLIEQTASAVLLATFYVHDAVCALEASTIQGVIRVGSVTPIRHAPPEVAGVINLRGKIVTLLDAGIILGFGKTVLTTDCRIFILEDQNEFIGLLVDHAGDVVETESHENDPLPVNITPHQARYFQRLCRSGGRVITVLNVTELLAEAKA